MADYKREALPQDFKPYEAEAASMGKDQFQKKRPYPFIVYARSKLWDPTLVLARQQAGQVGGETQMVSYEFVQGGITFLHPIRKRQTDPSDPKIMLGRATTNDMIVPVASVSSQHCYFMPPHQGQPLWTVCDLGSSNGTWHNEDQLKANDIVTIKDSEYLRLGGNLISWFIYPGKMHHLLNNPEEMKKLTDLA